MTVPPATILVVEDNDEMRAFLRCQLADHYHIVEAADGEEGWQRAQEEQPDLLLSDVQMPGTNGWALCRRVKESAEMQSIPVILLNGEAAGQDARAGAATETRTARRTAKNTSTERVPEEEDVGHDSTVDASGSSVEPSRPDVEVVLRKPFPLGELQRQLRRYLPARELPGYVDAAGDFLKDVVQLIERRLHDPDFKAGTLAEEMSLSRRHLTRRLKDAAEKTPASLIRERRIERAKAHFRNGDTKVADVCTTVGFRSASHFSQSFREYEGCSPTEYIERHVS